MCWKSMKIWKNTPKIGYFSKTAEIVTTTQTAQSSQKENRNKIHLSFYSTFGICNFGNIESREQGGTGHRGRSYCFCKTIQRRLGFSNSRLWSYKNKKNNFSRLFYFYLKYIAIPKRYLGMDWTTVVTVQNLTLKP